MKTVIFLKQKTLGVWHDCGFYENLTALLEDKDYHCLNISSRTLYNWIKEYQAKNPKSVKHVTYRTLYKSDHTEISEHWVFSKKELKQKDFTPDFNLSIKENKKRLEALIKNSEAGKSQTFNEFCYKSCDRLYDPKFPDDKQSNGYIQLKKMVVENITPASLEEIEEFEKNKDIAPDIKYLRFLHPLLRTYVIENWDIIKNLKIE